MLKNPTKEKLHTIPENYSLSSSQFVFTGEDTVSPGGKDRLTSNFLETNSVRIQESNQNIQFTSQVSSSVGMSASQENLNLFQTQNNQGSIKRQNQNPNKSNQNPLFELSQDSYARENEQLRQKIDEINELQQRKRVNSFVLEPKQAENILDQFKGLSVNYNNAQHRMLEIEKSLLTKSEIVNKQKEQIENLSRVVKSKMDLLGLEQYIKQLNLQATANNVDIFTEIANIKIIVDSSKAEQHEQEEWMEEQNMIIRSLQQEISQLKMQNQATVDFTENINTELKGAVDTLNVVQKDNQALQIDKEALLDYVEEMKNQYERCLTENLQIKNLSVELEDKLSLIIRENEDLRSEVRELEQKTQENERDRKTRDLQEKHSIQLLTNEIETLKREKDRIEAQLISSTSESTQIKLQLDQISLKHEKEGRVADIAIEKMQTREYNLVQTLRHLEEAILKLNREKEVHHQVIMRMKEFIQNKEVISLIEEIANICSEQLAIEREKNVTNIQIFQLEAKGVNTLKNGGDLDENKSNRNKFEGLKEIKKEYENNQIILITKQKNLEAQLSEKIEQERGKASRIQQIEKVNNHLRNDLSVLKNDIDMKEISRKNIESAYNILLTDYKRLSQDPNLCIPRQKIGDYQASSTSLASMSIMNTSSNSLVASRKANQNNLQVCSPSEQSTRKTQSISMPYNVYENYEDSLNLTKGSLKNTTGQQLPQFSGYSVNNRNNYANNNYQFE